MHSAVAAVSVWGGGGEREGTLRGVVWTENPELCRLALVPNLPHLKTVTWTAFRVIYFALFEKFEV